MKTILTIIIILISSSSSAFEIPKNKRIDHWVNYFQGRHFFQKALNKSALYRPKIVSIFEKKGLPSELSWLPLIESVYDCSALSEAKAAGCWQIMDKTGKSLGLKNGPWEDQRYNFEKSTNAAAVYLKKLHRRFGRWELAIAAYNYGPTALHKKVKKIGNDFWELKLPQETMDYVPKFYAVIVIVSDLQKYGFTKPKNRFVTVKLKKGSHNLRYIAKLLRVKYRDFENLNPGFKVGYTSPDRQITLFLRKDWNYKVLNNFGFLEN
jgi:membrane-bound lytic murein transglycosylase D